MTWLKKITLLAFLLGVLAALTPAANAAFEIRYYVDPVGPITSLTPYTFRVVDDSITSNVLFTLGQRADLDSSTPNQIRVGNPSGGALALNSAGTLTIVQTLGITNTPGAGTSGYIDVTNTTIRNATGADHTIAVYISATGFSVPSSDEMELAMTNSGSVPIRSNDKSDVTYNGYADAGNVLFGQGFAGPSTFNTVIGTGPASFSNPGSFAGGFDGNPPPFSLSLLGTYKLYATSGGTNITSTTANLSIMSVVPGPESLTLALAGLPFLSAAWLRRRTKRPNMAL